MRDIKFEIEENMLTHGGDFVKAIAEASRRADSNNYMKLREAFPELYMQYHPSNWVKKDK